MKCHPLPIFLGEDASHSGDRHRHLPRNAVKSGRKLYQIISYLEVARRVGTDIENDLTIAYKLQWNTRIGVDLDGDVRRKAVVFAPFANGPNEVRCCG